MRKTNKKMLKKVVFDSTAYTTTFSLEDFKEKVEEFEDWIKANGFSNPTVELDAEEDMYSDYRYPTLVMYAFREESDQEFLERTTKEEAAEKAAIERDLEVLKDIKARLAKAGVEV